MRRIAIVLSCLLWASVAQATTYYVRTDGSNTNAGTANTSGGAWLTIAKGCQTATAGDTVRVQAGSYIATTSGCTSGSSSSSTVTIVADGTVTTCGISFASKSYIRVIGLTIDPSTGGCSSGIGVSGTGTNTGLEFWNVTVQKTGANNGYNFDFASSSGLCNACIFLGGNIQNIGNPSAAYGMNLSGSDDFVGYINFSTICYLGVVPGGSRQRFVGLDFYGFIECSNTHPDYFYIQNVTLGYNNALIESAFAIGCTTCTDNKVYHAQNQSATDWNDDVFRLSTIYNNGSASSHSLYTTGTGNINRWRQYNNDHILGDRGVSGAAFDGCGGGSTTGPTVTAYVYNSIYDTCWAAGNTTNIDPLALNYAWTAKDYNLAFDVNGTDAFVSNWTSQAHAQTNINPQYTNRSGLDFSLSSGSGARGVGGPLTTASGAGSSSTTLTVAANTGSFFIGDNSSNLTQYGGHLVPGDVLTVGSCTAQVSSVSGDTITLASACTWNNADPVYYGSSSTIDIGAYPYKATGYNLTASYTVGTPYTITPNDTSLVRFVVCYSDNVPYAVVNASPYTCTAPSGAFSAYVYPRYASQTQSVAATLTDPNANSKALRNLSIRHEGGGAQ